MNESDQPVAPRAPHPVLDAYYQSGTQKHRFLGQIFDRTARHYDRIERTGFLGTGFYYRKKALRKNGWQRGMTMLDVAIGTGLVARAALALYPDNRVIGVDPSRGMMLEARKMLPIPLVQAFATPLPFRDGQFDFVCMGFALRHVADLRVTFEEYRRVLKKNGRLLLLEISKPDGAVLGWLTAFYLRDFMPRATGWITGDKEARRLMEYYWETIDQCVRPPQILEALRLAGFPSVERRVELGIFSEYLGIK